MMIFVTWLDDLFFGLLSQLFLKWDFCHKLSLLKRIINIIKFSFNYYGLQDMKFW